MFFSIFCRNRGVGMIPHEGQRCGRTSLLFAKSLNAGRVEAFCVDMIVLRVSSFESCNVLFAMGWGNVK